MPTNPDAVFIVQSYTRAEIAEELNAIIESESSDIKPFSPDDDRLTDEECQRIRTSGWCLDDGRCRRHGRRSL